MLARTGTDARFLAGLGLLAIAGGGLVLVGRRRRSALG
ncbi:MAG: LPXTG cell wall anchor domain-containing protein [Acidimicrobiales bacterium]|nr:LPXTG cell wall anchor domain-containing protein [Acidimicrobiales bacterium]